MLARSVHIPSFFDKDWVNVVEDYGADPTGTADSTTAFTNALASGLNVYIPVGIYLISSTLTIVTEGQQLIGPSWASTFGTKPAILSVQSTTIDVLKIEIGSASIAGLTIQRAPGYTSPTAGVDITFGIPGTSGIPTRMSIKNIQLIDSYVALKSLNHFTAIVDNLDIIHPKQYGFHMSSVPPYGGSVYRNIRVAGNGIAPAGIYIDQSDYNQWNLITVGGSAGFTEAHIHLKSSAGNLYNNQFVDTYLDNIPSGSYGVKIEKGAYNCLSNKFTALQMNTGSASGAYVGAGTEQNSFNGVKMPNHLGGNGFDIYGKETTIVDAKIGADPWSTNTYDGIAIYSGASGTIVQGSRIKKCRYGITVASGATYNNINDNDFRGNNTGAANIDSSARATSKIYHNQGLDDYLTSIASAPDYIGQQAFAGDKWYKAKGTASVDDWVLLSGSTAVIDGGSYLDVPTDPDRTIDGGTYV